MAKQYKGRDINGNEQLTKLTAINNTKDILKAVQNKNIAQDIFSVCKIFNVPQSLQCEISEVMATSSNCLTMKIIGKLFEKAQNLHKNKDSKDAIKNCLKILHYCSTNLPVKLEDIIAALEKAHISEYIEFKKGCTIHRALELLYRSENNILPDEPTDELSYKPIPKLSMRECLAKLQVRDKFTPNLQPDSIENFVVAEEATILGELAKYGVTIIEHD